ncbi:MAG: cytidylate kinase-like family protein [Gemmatimonadaceae bacterium]|nr:cytidylate kinase-like family protein [Gemmatimonadaceae bacterium]NUQ94469.1 cytidylate kinase-like family protein [Gemmatimonadaceae bacterium]NUR32441.1 cytidylate kinase-like family protein [Gemmatimonadaceae bacterium]NUS97864.1 cytidylate kinase-like family protein [Gemmatimonadaceae bacterium]
MAQADMITLSREYGAGAGELARRLSATLGWRVVGEDIPHLVADRLHLPDDAVEECDEHVPTLLENLGNALLMGNPDLLIDPEVAQRPDPERVFVAARDVMLDAAKTPPVILLGHGAQALFHDRPRTVHVRLVSPIEERVKRICGRRGDCTRDNAATLARRIDTDRVSYVRQHYGRDVRDPLLYHVQLNTGFLSMEDAARIIVELAERDLAAASDGAHH